MNDHTSPSPPAPTNGPGRPRRRRILVALMLSLAVLAPAAVTNRDVAASTSTTTSNWAVRVSAGGGTDFVSTSGDRFSADRYFTGGSMSGNITSGDIAGTENDALYRKHRWGMTSYAIPVPAGSYDVRLHFAETVFTAAGRRVFDVRLEGNLWLSRLDVHAEVGRNRALVKQTTVTVTDGTLDLAFGRVVEDP
jgi:hypothetical protein